MNNNTNIDKQFMNSLTSNENNSFWKNKLLVIYEHIIKRIKLLSIFKEDYNLNYRFDNNSCRLYINTTTFCDIIYMFSDNNYSKPIKGHIFNVESTLEPYIGQFLLYIQILCGYLYGIRIFTLDNAIQNHVRSARGIYKLFIPNINQNLSRYRIFQKRSTRYSNKAINKLLIDSESAMILNINEFNDDYKFKIFFLDDMNDMIYNIIMKRNLMIKHIRNKTRILKDKMRAHGKKSIMTRQKSSILRKNIYNRNNIRRLNNIPWNITHIKNIIRLIKNLFNISDYNNTIHLKMKDNNLNITSSLNTP